MTPKQFSWLGTTGARSTAVVIAAPSVSLASNSFSADGGANVNATVASFLDSEAVTYCVDQSTAPCPGKQFGVDTVPATGGTKVTSLTTLAGLSVGPHTLFAVGAAGDVPSASFSVVAGAAKKLAFATQPGGATAGSAFTTQPVVTIQDQFGNTASTNPTVNMNIGTNPASGTMTGCASTTTGGVATFTGCQINNAGTGYTLVASSTGLTSATSSAFNVAAATVTFAISTVHDSGAGNVKVFFKGVGGTAGGSIVVTICKVNSFPCSVPNTAATSSLASVPAGGNWTTGTASGNTIKGTTYFAQAVQSTPAATSATFQFDPNVVSP